MTVINPIITNLEEVIDSLPSEENWEGFPAMVWIIDRGKPNSRASDISGMEIYASSVVSSDPFELARQLRQCLD